MPITVGINQVKEDLGEELAKSLQEHYPGMYIYVSNNPIALDFESIEARNQYIFNLCNGTGKSYSEVAEMVGLTKDSVRKIVAKIYNNRN